MMSADTFILYELAAADHDVRFSPHCWKTRLALAHKGLEAKRVPWRFTQKDAIAFSGQGRVPVLVHGGTVVSDSWRIAIYLEEIFADRPTLFGAPEAKPLTRFINSWADAALLPALARIIVLDVHDCLDAEDRAYFRRSREARFGMPLERVVEDQVARIAEFRTAVLPLRQYLDHQTFLAGSTPGYADYCVFGMLMWAHCVSKAQLLEPDDPVRGWQERLFDAFDCLARRSPIAKQASLQ
jgi:glutathione S-transferase